MTEPTPTPTTTQSTAAVAFARGMAGAVGGAVAGHFLFTLALSSGFYMPVLPGALAGMGCGWLARARSNAIGGACCGVALVGTLVTRYLADGRAGPDGERLPVGEFLSTIPELPVMTLLLMGLGVFLGWHWGRGR